MGHYDTCREGNCPSCGQTLGVIWACGREGCLGYQEYLRTHDPKRLDRILKRAKQLIEEEEERRVTQRQIKRRTKEIAKRIAKNS